MAGTNRAYQSIRGSSIAAIIAATEHFRFCLQLDVDFQANHRLEFHSQVSVATKPPTAKRRLASSDKPPSDLGMLGFQALRSVRQVNHLVIAEDDRLDLDENAINFGE